MNDELKLHSNQAQRLEEYAKNILNLYLALQQYDPELATSILLSKLFSRGLNQHYKHKLEPNEYYTSAIHFMYEVYVHEPSYQPLKKGICGMTISHWL
jgi:hypothetical protein